MSFYRPYPWFFYGKKLSQKIDQPQFVGFFKPEDVEGRGLRLVIGRQENIALYWLVDETDGVISDIRYQMIGPSALIGALEAACQLLLRKNYDQARRISADLIDREVRDAPSDEAFPVQFYGYLNLVLETIEEAASQCMDIPIDETELMSPLTPEMMSGSGIEGWEELSLKEKLSIIEQVIQTEIRPYIELDAGGIQIIDLSDTHQLTIAYQGSCTSCHSATGSTLSAIQNILQAKVYPAIQVIPDLSYLKT
ncbi:MAG: NifU family protein [Rhabdochlamydiaceae bacterium]|nr:NifU family protein [Rhabdochlamydiaceae bacterium]